MSIILSHIWRNIKDKKLISALIILSLAITGALLFVALSIADILDTVADNDFQSVTTIFLLIFIVTSFMSVFVVFSSFKYIMALRVKTLGTLMSIGADKKRCRRIMLLESTAYGFIAAVFAVIAGIILLAVFSNSLTGGKAAFSISPVNLGISIVFCLILAPACAFFPIKTSDKHSVKEIILQTSVLKERKRIPGLVTGLCFLLISAALVLIPAVKYEEIAIIISFLFSIAGFAFCTGPLVYYSVVLLSRLVPNNYTVKMLKESRSHSNIAVLLSITVAVVFMINSSNSILIDATDKSFDLYGYDIHISSKTNDAVFDIAKVNEVLSTAGVDDAAGLYFKTEVDIEEHIPLMNLYGMTLSKMNDFFNFELENPVTSLPGKTMLLSKDYLAREKMSVGDILVVKGQTYTISGVITEMFNSGNVGVISENDFEDTFGIDKYTQIVCKSSEPNGARDALRAAGFPAAATIQDMLDRTKSINADLFTTVNYIIVLSTIAGVFGVLNNLLIAFASQKKEKALLRSIGMTQKKNMHSILLESLITGIIGGLIGLVGGIVFTTVVPAVFLVFEFPVKPVPLSPVAIALCAVCPVAICMLASLISLVGNSKLNIVQTLREEIL